MKWRGEFEKYVECIDLPVNTENNFKMSILTKNIWVGTATVILAGITE